MLKNSLVSFLFSTFAPAKMRADALLPRQDVESLSVIKHGDEHPAWSGASVEFFEIVKYQESTLGRTNRATYRHGGKMIRVK